MAGTKNSGNPWQIHVNPPAPLGVFIFYLAGKDKQGTGTWLINLVLKTFPKEAEDFFKNNPELLAEYRTEYAKLIGEQILEKKKREAEDKAREDRKLANEELKIHTYVKQTDLAEKKNETPEPSERDKVEQEMNSIKIEYEADGITVKPEFRNAFARKMELKKKLNDIK
jgi:hypothetical protein